MKNFFRKCFLSMNVCDAPASQFLLAASHRGITHTHHVVTGDTVMTQEV